MTYKQNPTTNVGAHDIARYFDLSRRRHFTTMQSIGDLITVRRAYCVMCAPAPSQWQYAKSRRLARAEDAEEAEEWIRDEDSIIEKMTGPNGVYVRYVSAPADDEEQDYTVRAGAMIT